MIINQCLYRDRLVILKCTQNMASLKGQACWAKMTSLGGKLTALVCHPTKYVNKAEQSTYLSTNIVVNDTTIWSNQELSIMLLYSHKLHS